MTALVLTIMNILNYNNISSASMPRCLELEDNDTPDQIQLIISELVSSGYWLQGK